MCSAARTEGVRQDSYFLKSRFTDADNVLGKPEETSKLGRLRWTASCVAEKANTCKGGDEERAEQAWSLTTD